MNRAADIVVAGLGLDSRETDGTFVESVGPQFRTLLVIEMVTNSQVGRLARLEFIGVRAAWTARLFITAPSGLRRLQKRAPGESAKRRGEMETEIDIVLEPGRKGLFQMQVVMVNEYCSGAHMELEIVSADLLGLDGDKQPCCAEEAQQSKLQNAGMYLGLALATMDAARHIALSGGGGAPSPDAPLVSMDDIAGDPDVCRALESLEEAEALATDAHDRVEAARGRLGAAALLWVLDDEVAEGRTPWDYTPGHSERHDGIMELDEAKSTVVELVKATTAAVKEALGLSGSTSTD
jgi:hypothetical protein